METNICPYLDLAGNAATAPLTGRRCTALKPSVAVDAAHQTAFCLKADHVRCTLYMAVQPGAVAAGPAPTLQEPASAPAASPDPAFHPSSFTRSAGSLHPWLRRLSWIALGLIVLAVAVTYGRDFMRPPAAAPASTATAPAATAALSAGPAETSTPLPTGAAAPTAARPTPTRAASPSPVPGGSSLALQPAAGASGWWASGETLAEHLDDSFLYAGYYNGRATLSAVQFDLRRVRRGAPILDARLVLTGLNAEKFDAAAGGSWSVQILDPRALPELARAGFQALYNAPAAVSLFPTLYPADLGTGVQSVFVLDAAARAWLEKQVVDGATAVVFRLLGPGGGGDTLFAWDSGTGPATRGNAPQLELSLGAPPSTPPPLATVPVLVATLTPTPANVLTAAAYAGTATAVATTIGTYTPLPYALATATPPLADIAAAQAWRALQGLPPLVVYTPVPANAATATADALYATAVAVTTGTFTPVPTNAVTPVIVLPTPIPDNAATAVAQWLGAAAQAQQVGTPTPLPPGAVVATITPAPLVIASTATPANAATAVMRAAEATLSALTVGAYTPIPRNARTPTPEPPPTPLPLLVRDTPRPTSTPAPALPPSLPAVLKGLILFRSDRNDQVELFALDPAAGVVYRVTQEWPFSLAQTLEGRAPDGFAAVVVQNDNRLVPELYIRDSRYPGLRQLTSTTGWSYDAAWSPTGDSIAFVSQEPGNDEIHTIRPDGSDMRRLTANDWEWDKHPSWSPDGTRIVFWSNRETGRRQLWIMNADGGNQRRLLDSPYNDWDPIWVK